MDYEQKYKEAFERARNIHKYSSDLAEIKRMEYIFPELAESEDERIRKELLEHCKNQAKPYIQTGNKCLQIQSWIDWLEKQGSNLVKNGYTNNKDVIEYAGNYSRTIWRKLMDNFKNIKDYHIGCNDVSDIVLNAIINTYNWLEKQGQKSAEWHREDEQNLNACLGYIPDEFLRRWLTDIIHIKYDKSTWSKEDDVMVHDILGWIPAKSRPEYNQRRADWLKSLKGRVQPEQEWSEDDEQYLLVCKNALRKYQVTDKWDSEIISQWLDKKIKSIKQRIGG